MVEIEPYKMRERTNLTEHNDIINKVNEIVDVINDVDMERINTRLTKDESQIAVNTAGIKTNSDAIASVDQKIDTEISTVNTKIDTEISKVDYRLDGHDSAICNLREKDTALENAMPKTYTLYRDGTGKIKAQVETIDGSLMNSNTLDMIIPYQYDIVSGTTNRSFKLNITMSDGSSYTTNDFVIPEGGGTDVTVTGITLSKDTSDVNRFHVGINLSDGTMIDSGFISMVDNVSGTFADNKLTITVNGVSSVPIEIDASGASYTAGTGIVISDGSISIDSTIVALKSDISDMETKTDAIATFATKTEVESVKTTANDAKSTADDANTKVNNCFDNVSVSGSTMTFTKINDEHLEVDLPTSSFEVIDMSSINVSCYPLSSSTKVSLEVCPTFSFYGFYNGKIYRTNNARVYITNGMPTLSYYIYTIPNKFLVTFATKVDNALNLKDGITYIFATTTHSELINVEKSDGEIISVNSGKDLTMYSYTGSNPDIQFGGIYSPIS